MKIDQQSQIELSALQLARSVAEARSKRERKERAQDIYARIQTLEENIDRLKDRTGPRVKQTVSENRYELAILSLLGDFMSGDAARHDDDDQEDETGEAEPEQKESE